MNTMKKIERYFYVENGQLKSKPMLYADWINARQEAAFETWRNQNRIKDLQEQLEKKLVLIKGLETSRAKIVHQLKKCLHLLAMRNDRTHGENVAIETGRKVIPMELT